MPAILSNCCCARWLDELVPEPDSVVAPGAFFAASTKSFRFLIGLSAVTSSASGVKWNQNTVVISSVL